MENSLKIAFWPVKRLNINFILESKFVMSFPNIFMKSNFYECFLIVRSQRSESLFFKVDLLLSVKFTNDIHADCHHFVYPHLQFCVCYECVVIKLTQVRP